MKIPKIEINRGTNRLESELGKGKSMFRVIYDIFFFIPVTIVVAAVIVITVAIGVPTAMDLAANVLGVNSQQNEQEHQALDFIFNDVPANSSNFDSVMYLYKQNIITGFEDGTIRPELPITRAEMIKMVVTAKKLYPLVINYRNCYTDVHNEWFAQYVCLAKEKGWIKSGGKFRPNDTLSRAEAVTVLVQAFDLKPGSEKGLIPFQDVEKGSWYYQNIITAQSHHMFKEDPIHQFFYPEELATRGDIFKMLYRLILL